MFSITLILSEIFMIFDRHAYQTKTVCFMQSLMLSLVSRLNGLPWKNFKSPNYSYTLWDILVIFGKVIF